MSKKAGVFQDGWRKKLKTAETKFSSISSTQTSEVTYTIIQ